MSAIHALLIGLEEPWGIGLGHTLSAAGSVVRSIPFDTAARSLRAVRRQPPDVVFCAVAFCPRLLADLRGEGIRVPVVAVSRVPEVELWLNALESGAADYCAAPFEPRQVRWVLDTSIHAR